MGGRKALRRWVVGQHDPREMPAYGVVEAARYLRMPDTTLRAWVRGQSYVTDSGQARFFKPVIRLPDPEEPLLSFMNLIEAHVLDAIRRDHRISLQKIRKALLVLAKFTHSEHPLAEQRFETDGVHLFVQHYGQLVSLTQDGQLAIRKVIEAYLQRVERDEIGLVARLYPFTRKRHPEEPRVVMIDPQIAFGRPVLVGSGIPTAIVAERYKAGESVDELADDYGRARLEIEEAIRCELEVREAA